MLGRHATWNAAWHAPRYDAATSRLPYATWLPRTDVFGDSSKHRTKLTGVGVFRTTIWDATLKGQKRNRGASVSLCRGVDDASCFGVCVHHVQRSWRCQLTEPEQQYRTKKRRRKTKTSPPLTGIHTLHEVDLLFAYCQKEKETRKGQQLKQQRP